MTIVKPMSVTSIVANAKKITAASLPSTISVALTGVAMSGSSEARSRSPAVTSTAT